MAVNCRTAILVDVKVALLGPVELTDDHGVRIDLPSRRQRQLLAILGLNRSRIVDVELIGELIWGEEQPADLAGAVQTHVSRLRRLLADPLSLETAPSGYALNCPDDHIDIARFERLVGEVRDAPPAAVPEPARRALGLWRGRPLPDVEHPDLEAERQRLVDLRVEVSEALAEALSELGRHREAIELADQIVRDHPYRERPVATLMRSQYAVGRQADALATFADLRNRLRDDLGVDPSHELRDLELAILQQSVEPVAQTDVDAGRSGELEQRIRICTTRDGTRLAYAVSGTGPPLVKAANWMTHLDFDWESPVWRHWNEGLSAEHTLVRYDERGCGLSDWDVDRFTFDAWVDDLASVVDAVGLERFPLLGISQGGAVAIAYAVRHPERVSSLVLWGAYPRGRAVRASTEQQRREADLNIELARIGWGTGDATFLQVFTSQFMPDGTRDQWEAFNELQRRTCSAENAVRFMEVFATIDVTDLAPQVTCPTLIMHSRNELRVGFENARELAALVPQSQLVPLESRNHILLGDEPAWPRFLHEVNAFLAD